MEQVVITVLSALLPIMSILSFVLGYNMNAPKKIAMPRKKEEKKLTEDEEMLERINNARV